MFKTENPPSSDHDTPRNCVGEHDASTVGGDLAQLLAGPLDADVLATNRPQISGAVVGTLVGFADSGAIPLVTYREQPGTAALPARATIELHGAHIGQCAVLIFEEGDPRRPIVVGCLVDGSTRSLSSIPDQVDVEADGNQLVVSAKERIVLRCGKASITLTKEGKLILQGEYVSSHSAGVLRIKGGSVQIN